MSELDTEEVHRAVAALIPFVRRWNLPLNPEDIDEMVYAMLVHTRSDLSADEIMAAVDRQIDDHEQRALELREAMTEALKRR